MSTAVLAIVILAISGALAAFVWSHPEARAEKLFVATLGALMGSLVGRLVSDPRWPGHLFYAAVGAFVFAALDWMRRRHGSAR